MTTTQDTAAPDAVARMRSPRPQADRGFRFGTGSLALDLVATVHRDGDDRIDLLSGTKRLGEWLAGPGLPLPAGGLVDADVSELVSLREAIEAIARALVAGRAPQAADVRRINVAARRPTPVYLLGPTGRTQQIVEEPDAASVLAVIARDAIRLFTGADIRRLRECARDGCTTLFYDRSPSGGRRWCSMKGCGEIVASASYRRRRDDKDRT